MRPVASCWFALSVVILPGAAAGQSRSPADTFALEQVSSYPFPSTLVAFIGIAGQGGPPEPLLEDRPLRWEIWTADVASGAGRATVRDGAAGRAESPAGDGGQLPGGVAAQNRVKAVSRERGTRHCP